VAGRREAEGAESVALFEKAGGSGLFLRTDVISEEQIAGLLRSGGAIVNNASVAALRPVADAPIYSLSKLAVIGLTKRRMLLLIANAFFQTRVTLFQIVDYIPDRRAFDPNNFLVLG
jgi:hypothetical protein